MSGFAEQGRSSRVGVQVMSEGVPNEWRQNDGGGYVGDVTRTDGAHIKKGNIMECQPGRRKAVGIAVRSQGPA